MSQNPPKTLPKTLPNPPHRRCGAWACQTNLMVTTAVNTMLYIGGGVRRLGEAKIFNFPRSLGAMMAPFFDLGCFLSAFCVSCCVCCRTWPVFERLEALRRRFRSLRGGFWRVSRGRGVVFGAPGVHFSALLQACTLIPGKSFQCVKTIVFPRFFQVFHISRAFCAH